MIHTRRSGNDGPATPGHLIILYPANPGTDNPFPPYIDRKAILDPIVGRVV